MKKLYLLGHPVSHSLSPVMQNAALEALGLDWEYSTLDVAPEDLMATLEGLEADPDVIGCNVTVPHKVAVFQRLLGPDVTRLREEAVSAQAVNTLYRKGRSLAGDSTDSRGAHSALWIEGFGEGPGGRGRLPEHDLAILGTGGTAQSLAPSFARLSTLPKSISVFGRDLSKAIRVAEATRRELRSIEATNPLAASVEIEALDLSRFRDWNRGRRSITIQTTTVGMETGEAPGQSPVPPGSVGDGQIAFDVVYKPHETPFLLDAKKNGATIVHGIGMLIGQGALALEYWIKASADEETKSRFDLAQTISVMRAALGIA